MDMGKDDKLVRAVEARLASDEHTRDAAIEVSSLAGEVTLSGQVDSQAAKDAAEALAQSTPGVTVVVTSFSYRHGLPRDADLVFDMRFLRNPHYVPALQPLSGRDRAVGAFIEADSDFAPRFAEMAAWLDRLLPRYEAEGKSYLTIAIGCTGGRHRSVYVAERLAARLAADGRRVALMHRDLDRPGEAGPHPAEPPVSPVKDIA